MQPHHLSQRARLAVLTVSLAGLIGTSVVVDGSPAPDPGTDSLWYYSAALALLLGDLVVEPWYTRPADAVANAAAVFLASLGASDAALEVSNEAFDAGRYACIAVSGTIATLGIFAMLTRRERPARQTQVHQVAFVLSSTLGRARILFAAFFAVTAAAAYGESPDKLLALYLMGGLLLWTRPIQYIAERLATQLPKGSPAELVVTEIAQPSTAFVKAQAGTDLRVGQPVMRAGARVGLVVAANETDVVPSAETALDPDVLLETGDSLELGPIGERDENVLGPVGRQTSLDRVVVTGSGSTFDEAGATAGSLVEVDVRGEPVLYQIVDAEIESARPEGSATSKRVRVVARKLGRWDEAAGNFEASDWIPRPGVAALRATATRTATIDTALVGRVPGTDYGTRYDPVSGATHNTAILGILGIGKTTLATELAWRTLDRGAKVIVIDITNEYAAHFESLFSPGEQEAFETQINDATKARLTAKDYEGTHAGNQALFRRTVREKLAAFMASEHRLLIVNPARLTVTRDDGGFPDARGDAKRLVSLNPAEVTAVLAQGVLDQVSGDVTDELRVCLVLEEAHSLAPEWNSTANEGEKQAATATARALMQGRKFGFGSIVVTQRTANVTKSILNQCNTVFAMRVYDQTGTEFLGNFIGNDYARLLANLRDRHAIVFGKASSCSSPLLVELNDRDELDAWRHGIAERIGADRGSEHGADGTPQDPDASEISARDTDGPQPPA